MSREIFTIRLGGLENKVNVINEISERESKGREILGTGFGQDVGHCLYMGAKLSKAEDFMEEVRFFRYRRRAEFPAKNLFKYPNIISFYK